MKEEPAKMTFMIKPAIKKHKSDYDILTQPLTAAEFHNIGFYAHHLQAISQKLADIKTKIPGEFIKEQLKSWFISLSPLDRVKMLTIRSPNITWVIKHMFTRSILFENCMFSFTVQNSQLSYKETKGVYENPAIQNADKILIDSVRLTDDETVLDTFSISLDLAADPKKLFSALDTISHKSFGLKPCGIHKNGSSLYTWEFPEWFKYENENLLGAWIAAIIEKLLWLEYGVKLTTGKHERPCMPLLLHADILKFWKQCPKDERIEILVEFMKSAKNEPQVERSHRQEAFLKLNLIAQKCAEETFVDKLVFRELEEIYSHEIRGLLLNIIRNRMSNKAAEELLKEIGKTEKDAGKGKEEKERNGIDLDGMDVGLLTGKKSTKYDYLYTENHKKQKQQNTDGIKKQEIPPKIMVEETTKITNSKSKEKITKIPEKINHELAQKISNQIIYEIIEKMPIKSMPQYEPVIKTDPEKPIKTQKKRKKKLPTQPSKKPVKPKVEVKKLEQKIENSKEQTDFEPIEEKLNPTDIEKEHYLNSYGNSFTMFDTFTYVSTLINKRFTEIQLLNKQQEKHREVLIQLIESDVQKCFNDKNLKAVIYGSARIGLAIESSDLDIGITGTKFQNRHDVEIAIEKLNEFLNNCSYIASSEIILTAKVPVIKLIAFIDEKQEKYCKVDITFNMPIENQVEKAIQAAELSIQLMEKCQFLREIVIFLKEKLSDSCLNIPYQGGISSYALLLLCAAYYSICPKFTSPGECLIRILDFYSNYFNNMLYGVYYEKGTVSYFTLELPIYYGCLVVNDPCNVRNNITASLYRFDAIRACFGKLLANLTMPM